MSPKHISNSLSPPKPNGDELAALVSREDKEEQFDRCLSEERLNREFASTCLDVDKAWAKLQKLSTQFGSEDFSKGDNRLILNHRNFVGIISDYQCWI